MMTIATLKEKRLPKEPGVYLMKGKDSDIIYIGKAKDLNKRVTSYFVKKDHDPKTARLVLEMDALLCAVHYHVKLPLRHF